MEMSRSTAGALELTSKLGRTGSFSLSETAQKGARCGLPAGGEATGRESLRAPFSGGSSWVARRSRGGGDLMNLSQAPKFARAAKHPGQAGHDLVEWE